MRMTKKNERMGRRIVQFLKYYFFWLLSYVVFKALFMLYNHDITMTLTPMEIVQVFLHGLKMDASAAGYATLLPGVLMAVGCLGEGARKVTNRVVDGYTYIVMPLVVLLVLGDMALYPAWGVRIDRQVLPYLTDPLNVMNSVSGLQLLAGVGGWIVISVLLLYLYKRFFSPHVEEQEKRIGWRKGWRIVGCVGLLLVTALLILPIRGGVGSSPLNFSSVYFSEKTYANHAAYNPFWCFFYALTHNDYSKNPVHYMTDEEAESVVRDVAERAALSVSDATGGKEELIVKSQDGKKVNVVLVILESFTPRVIGALGGEKGLTPNLDRMAKEGLCFTQFYSTGNRSDRGLSGLLAQYPALIGASSILGFPNKMVGIDYLPEEMKRNGYDLSFHYGGDLDFYNTGMMLVQAGVEKVVSRPDFPIGQNRASKWGVPDAYLYQRAAEDILKLREPYMAMVYNISTHEPFDIPSEERSVDADNEDKRYKDAVRYCDKSLGKLVETLRKSEAWAHTLVIVTADHTARLPEPATDVMESETYRIPMIWLGGALAKKGEVTHISQQTDLGYTLARLLDLKGFEANPFQKDMLTGPEYALYFRSEGWGIVTPDARLFRNLDTGKDYWEKGELDGRKDSVLRFGEAYTQYLHNDFIKR